MKTVTVYTDYKSPYAYLAKDLAYALEDAGAARLEWLPCVLDIPSFLGSAEVDETHRVIRAERNAHQWRRVRYLYMDCRRQARRRGLTIRGPRKIWDSIIGGDRHAVCQATGNSGVSRLPRSRVRALLET